MTRGSRRLAPVLISLILLIGVLAGCSKSQQPFTIVAGSENETLEPLVTDFCKQQNVDCRFTYMGAVDISLALEQSDFPYDAVWAANSLWVDIGDQQRRVKDLKSIMRSPVVLGIRKSLAAQLGFVDRKVETKDILAAVESGHLKFLMTSATQSNSGASAYLGFLSAALGQPEVLTDADLQRPDVKDKVRRLLAGVQRSAGSSGWLKDLFLTGVKDGAGYDAMVNYESLIIEADQELIKLGKEPLYVVYPADGVAVADSPLGFVPHGNAASEAFFQKLQDYLLSDATQAKLQAFGRRPARSELAQTIDPAVFNPDWGIDVKRVLTAVRLPKQDVTLAALNLYQEALRKPSLTALCLDFSGSMQGEGERQLKAAVASLFDAQKTRQYLIQPSPEDRFIVIPFSSSPIDAWTATGDPAALGELARKVEALEPGGGTDIYACAAQGLAMMAATPDFQRYVPAVVIMTDGQSQGDFSTLEQAWRSDGHDVPIFSITFGEADPTQLDKLATLTRARVFDGRTDLEKAFRTARGYN
jgi:Ca-activated chloride channel homolog